jgi:hypothetical protein
MLILYQNSLLVSRRIWSRQGTILQTSAVRTRRSTFYFELRPRKAGDETRIRIPGLATQYSNQLSYACRNGGGGP